MHARPLIGYTGVTVVLLAALACIGRFSEPGGDAPGALLPFLALGLLGWTLGHYLRAEPARATLSRSLSLLGDALAGPCVWWTSLLLDSGGDAAALRAAALGGVVFLALAAWRLVRDPAPGPLHPYFVAAWGGLAAELARAAPGLPPPVFLAVITAIAVLVAAAEVRLSGAARPHAAVAAALLLGAGVAGTAARLAAPPSGALLAAFHASAIALVLWAALRGEALGPLGRWLGGTAYTALTIVLTATLAYLHAPLAVYIGATAAWIATLAVLAMALRSARFDPFRDSAAWTAALLTCAFATASAPAWWPAVGLPRIGWAAAWHEAARGPWVVRAATAGGLAIVGAAAGALAFFRGRHPSIAYSIGGFAANGALRATLAYAAPLLVLAAACTAAAGSGAVTTLAPLAVAAALLLAKRLPAYGHGLACAGYAAVLAAAAVAPAAGAAPAAVLVAGAGLIFVRATRTRALTPVVGALAALSIAVVSLSMGRPTAAEAVALVALLALAMGRLLLDREAEGTRTGAVLGWGTLAAGWAIALAIVWPPWPVAGVLALWLGTPLLLAGRRRTEERTAYDPQRFVGEALETAALLVAHCGGAAALVLSWQWWGLPAGDAGPMLAGWAWAHLWLYRRLARRLPGRPVTAATAIASQALALVSLGLPLASSSLRIAIATLLMNAALFFFWSDQPGTRGRRRLLMAAGHVLNLAAIATALVEASAWALLASALVYLWRAQRTHSAATHLAFLVTVTVASGLALSAGGREPAVWVPSLTAVGLLAVGALSQATAGRTVAVRLSWAWAVMIGLVTVLGAASCRLAVARDLAVLWLGFLLAALVFDRHRDGASERPGEPEDEWLSLASHWVGHLAGGAALVAFCVVQGFGLGVASAALGAWAWLHWGIALSADAGGTAGRALGQAGRASAASALVLAALAWRETGPATLACALAGAFALLVGLTAADRWWRLVSALAVTEAVWIQGLGAGVTLREYYLTTAATCLYLALRLRGAPSVDARGFLGGSASVRWREARAALLPIAILALAVGYPFVALLRGGEAVHLACLGAGTGLVLLGFWRARQSRLFESAVCGLFLGGALYAFATSGLDRTSAALLLAAGLLVLANLLAGDALFARVRAFSGRTASGVLPRGA